MSKCANCLKNRNCLYGFFFSSLYWAESIIFVGKTQKFLSLGLVLRLGLMETQNWFVFGLNYFFAGVKPKFSEKVQNSGNFLGFVIDWHNSSPTAEKDWVEVEYRRQ